jgi:hypothetical protein
MTMSNEAAKSAAPRFALLTGMLFAIAVGVLWAFPAFWYRGAGTEAQFVWLAEQTNVPGWDFKDVPIAKAAEAVLVGDRMANGEFFSGDATRVIHVFSAKRYLQKENEIGLFSHTPDRCWTGTGWEIELIEPEFVECQIHDLAMRFERRLFVRDAVKELVYFGAIVGGKALPYRLDQHLAANLKKTKKTKGDSESTLLRLRSSRLWGWTWDSFVHRTAFGGPQQFIRISTPVAGTDLASADERLRSFLPQWLVNVDYEKEYGEWMAARGREDHKTTGLRDNKTTGGRITDHQTTRQQKH